MSNKNRWNVFLQSYAKRKAVRLLIRSDDIESRNEDLQTQDKSMKFGPEVTFFVEILDKRPREPTDLKEYAFITIQEYFKKPKS